MLEILKALGWPHFAFAFALVFVLLFRHQLSALISRVTSIDKTGLKAGQLPEAQREAQNAEAVQELLLAIGDSIVIHDVEGRIRTELESRNLETQSATAKVLIKYLAASSILVSFEQVHNLIFGSQIHLLKRLNEVAGQGLPRQLVVNHFEHVQKLFPEQLSTWSFDQYMAFLFGRLLVVAQGGGVHITNLGVEFLTWMARNGRSENKPL